jgi:hypothetical protein
MNQIKYLLIVLAALTLVGCGRAMVVDPQRTNSESEVDASPEEGAGKTPAPTRSISGNTTILADGLLVA